MCNFLHLCTPSDNVFAIAQNVLHTKLDLFASVFVYGVNLLLVLTILTEVLATYR